MAKLVLSDLRCSVEDIPEKIFKRMRKRFSYRMDFHTRRNLTYPSDGRVHMISKNGSFMLGIAADVKKFLETNGVDLRIDDLRTPVETPSAEDIKVSLKMMPFTPRPYQLEQILRCCVKRHGLIHSCTGSGKTFTMSAVITAWDRPTVILVKSKDLMYQLQREIAEYRGEYTDDIGLIGDGRFNPKRYTIAMVQTLTNARMGKKKKARIKDFMDECEVLLVDEVHNAQSKTFKQAIRKAKNAVVRLGFSATPITSSTTDIDGTVINKDIILRSYFGPVIHRVRTVDLIEKGYLASCEVKMIKNDLYFDGVTLHWADEYTRIIVEDDERNDMIAKIIANNYNNDKTSITFVTRLDHGTRIADLLVDKYGLPEYTIGYVTGEDHAEDRSGKILDFAEGNISVLIGTVLSEGLNFFCDVGINASCGKSTKVAIQRTGRILRKVRDPEIGDVNTEVDEHVVLYDFADKGHPFFEDHSKARVEVYKSEGHPVNYIEESEIED